MAIGGAAMPDNDDGGGKAHSKEIVVLPPPPSPPPPRQPPATTTARTVVRADGGRGGVVRGLDPPRGDSGDKRLRRSSSADVVTRGTADGAFIATDGGRMSLSIHCCCPPSHPRCIGAGGGEFVKGDDCHIQRRAGSIVGLSRQSSSNVVVLVREDGPADAAPANDDATAEGGNGDTMVTTMTTMTTMTTAPFSLLGIGSGQRNWSGRPSLLRGVSFRSSPLSLLSSCHGNFDSSRWPTSSTSLTVAIV